ncbi:MAG: hypothetical protein R2856_32920 [Caldilineaceae bacterium]
MIQRKLPPSAALAAVAQDAPDNVADKLHRLSEDLRWLAERTSTPGTAHKLFFELERRLGYAEAMGRGAGDDALGLARVAAVKRCSKWRKARAAWIASCGVGRVRQTQARQTAARGDNHHHLPRQGAGVACGDRPRL